MTELPKSEGHTCILVAVDRFSKACKLIPLRRLPTVLETAEQLFAHVFRNYGIPEDIIPDRGPQFISQVWKAFFCLLGVTVSLSSGYHPQMNGQAERKIQELGHYLQAYCQEDQYGWNRFLPWAKYAQNSLGQNSTGLMSFQCIFGNQPPLFPWTGEPSEVPAVYLPDWTIPSFHYSLAKCPVPGPRFPSFRQRQPTISIQLSSLNGFLIPYSHLTFAPNDLHSYMSINT